MMWHGCNLDPRADRRGEVRDIPLVKENPLTLISAAINLPVPRKDGWIGYRLLSAPSYRAAQAAGRMQAPGKGLVVVVPEVVSGGCHFIVVADREKFWLHVHS